MRLNKINVVFLHKISCIRQFKTSFYCAHLHYLCSRNYLYKKGVVD